MLYSTRSKLIFSFLSVALLVGTVSLVVGWQLLYDSVLNEANNRVRQDLNVARVIYDDRVAAIRLSLEATGLDSGFSDAVVIRDRGLLGARTEKIAKAIRLDFAGIIAADGTLLSRLGGGDAASVQTPGGMAIAHAALQRRRAVSGTVVLDSGVLQAEAPGLAEKSRIPTRSTDPSPPTAGQELPIAVEVSGLAIAAAVPVMKNGGIVGAIYGGMLLNRDESIVDKIGGTVFRNEVYRGHNVGTATIFFRNLRIATNVLETAGQRALGTFASPEVTQRVLVEGRKWTDRAFVVNDWYITAYEPITDIDRRRVGMLYVGVLEAKYRDVRENALWVFAGITLAGVAFAIALGCLLANRIMLPVHQLIHASTEISAGNLSPQIGPISKSDIGLLQNAFKEMCEALVRRDQEHREESEKRLIQSEKQASIGKLAAGVAHEINNPLTAVLTFSHLILRRKDLPAEVRQDVETIALQTERVRKIVKGLLDFSRQSRLDTEPLKLERLLEDCVRLMENQALIRGVTLRYESREDMPVLTLDRSQIQAVMVNMILNALDATEPGGKVEIVSKLHDGDRGRGIDILVRDTGTGIAPEHMGRLFDPFFTTKEVGKGTGLGLAVSVGIIERHGGRISVESIPGTGSLFTIWLPCSGEAVETGHSTTNP
ncbi:cache domain-containing protein [Desulfococcus sp.]|uniref:cache domain-containing protein n=1 Tax=Desulfococcus sp. TaxID=2025834 RepID=UPI003593ADDE